MITFFRRVRTRRMFLLAPLLAMCLALIFPAIASAHAILLKSDPAQDQVLSTAPSQVRMWFSEDLNPAFTTAVVVNANNQRVDLGDAHIAVGNPREMDVGLKPNLPAAVYVVVYRTDSANDGHILRGSFIFSVGIAANLSPGSTAGQNALGGGNLTGLYTGQFDGPTLFNLVMITLVELCAVFWVGAQLWLNFVFQLASDKHAEQQLTNERVHRRFEQCWAVPTLAVLLLANIGVLVGQALNLTGGQWGGAFSPTLLFGLATSGRFGTYWIMREVVIGLALLLALYVLLFKRRPRGVNAALPLLNLGLGMALFIAISMSSHASAVSGTLVIYAVLVDWLHLLAAALWVGGMLYIALNYLPGIRSLSTVERVSSLLTILPYFSVLAIAGVVIMAITGPLSATFHLTSLDQFLSTAYGRALLVKILLVGGLLLTSAVHVGLLRPRLKKEYQKYAYAVKRLQTAEEDVGVALRAQQLLGSDPMRHHQQHQEAEGGTQSTVTTSTAINQSASPTSNVAHQVKLREGRLTQKANRLTSILRWEPVLGVAVLVCVGLMNVFAGTLTPTAVAQQPNGSTTKPFTATVRTQDNKFSVTLSVNPNRFGTNVFTVSVVDGQGKPVSNTTIGVALYTTMLDMDMGTSPANNLQPSGQYTFSGRGDLEMAGYWQIRVQIRTLDNTLHEAFVKLLTPF